MEHEDNRTKLRIKLLRIMPNTITMASLFCAIFAIEASSRDAFGHAITAIVMSALFDAIDGTVARILKVSNTFGVILDSLTDSIAFGVAPALILYYAYFTDTDFGILWIFIYCACAVIRLAKFSNTPKPMIKKIYFRGMPSTAAAMVVIMPIAYDITRLSSAFVQHKIYIIFYILIISYLMVSKVPCLAFNKAIAVYRQYTVTYVLGIIAIGIIAIKYKYIALFVIGAFVFLSLILGVLFCHDDEKDEQSCDIS